jgi:hypothetical protein
MGPMVCDWQPCSVQVVAIASLWSVTFIHSATNEIQASRASDQRFSRRRSMR